MLFATHYLEEADAYADRIVLVSHGRIVADGSAAEIKALASGRTVRATLPHRRRARPCAAPGRRLASRCAATACSCTPATPTRSPATCSPATDARDLEITSRGLEDAFLALTGDEPIDHDRSHR